MRFAHDVENRLAKVVLPSGEEVSYGYAATGQRIWRRDAKGQTYFVTDGVNLVAELDKDLKPQASFLYGSGIDRPLMMDRDGGSYYFHPDWVGTIRRLTDERGAVAASYEYDAFGQVVSKQGTQRSPFRFTARELDEATGLYYYRARYYDPALGRFLTKDPVHARGTDALALNAYAYARNNPIRYVDGMGLEPNQVSYGAITLGRPASPPAAQAGNSGAITVDSPAMPPAANPGPPSGQSWGSAPETSLETVFEPRPSGAAIARYVNGWAEGALCKLDHYRSVAESLHSARAAVYNLETILSCQTNHGISPQLRNIPDSRPECTQARLTCSRD